MAQMKMILPPDLFAVGVSKAVAEAAVDCYSDLVHAADMVADQCETGPTAALLVQRQQRGLNPQ